jgi:hypothetical protein
LLCFLFALHYIYRPNASIMQKDSTGSKTGSMAVSLRDYLNYLSDHQILILLYGTSSRYLPCHRHYVCSFQHKIASHQISRNVHYLHSKCHIPTYSSLVVAVKREGETRPRAYALFYKKAEKIVCFSKGVLIDTEALRYMSPVSDSSHRYVRIQILGK